MIEYNLDTDHSILHVQPKSAIDNPPSPRAMWTAAGVTGRSRSRGPKRGPTDSVLLALLLRCACEGEDGARH